MDSPNTSYYQPATGTIAGFDSIGLPSSDPTLAKSGWSIEQIRRFLLNESGTNFPTADRVDEIEALVLKHINDNNNPHGVSVDAISQNVSSNILSGIIPGTAPTSSPFFAWDATCPLPMGTIFPATYSTSNFYRTVEGGRLVNPATEADVLGVDATNGPVGLPLYSILTNVVPTTWPTNTSLPQNTKVTKIPNTTFNYPFDFYRVDETNATGDFGVNIPVQLTTSSVYTFTVFLQPLYIDGYFAIRQPGNDQAVMLVDANTGQFILGSSSIQGNVVTYPSGILKVSYSFVATTNGPSRIQLLHRLTTGTEVSRIGITNRPLFMFGLPLLSNAPIGAPIPVDPSLAATTTPMVPNFTLLGVPGMISRLMISMSMIFKTQLSAMQITDTLLFQLGDLSIVRDNARVYVKLGNQTLFNSLIVDGLNTFSVSYSPTEIMFKDLTNAKQVVNGTYSSLITANTRIGPCSGHLRSIALYPENDRAKCLEFLTNG